MALSRTESGLCIANLHASQVQPLPQEELPRAGQGRDRVGRRARTA